MENRPKKLSMIEILTISGRGQFLRVRFKGLNYIGAVHNSRNVNHEPVMATGREAAQDRFDRGTLSLKRTAERRLSHEISDRIPLVQYEKET